MSEQVPPAPKSATPSRMKIVVAAAALALGVVGFLMLPRAPTSNPMHWYLGRCMANVKQLGVAIAMFADDHNGSLPEKIEDISQYRGSYTKLICPSAKDQIHCSYALTGATNVWGASTNTIILLEVEANHYGKRVVLFDDGRVELRAASDL